MSTVMVKFWLDSIVSRGFHCEYSCSKAHEGLKAANQQGQVHTHGSEKGQCS